MARKPSEVKKPTPESPAESSPKLDLGELYKQAGIPLHLFMGVIADAGLQGKYKETIENMKRNRPLEKIMTLEEFNKAKEKFLKKAI